MRAAFHEQLDDISDLLAEMAIAAGTAMNQATQALLNADLSVAEAVISGDDHLDELTSEVERRCYDAAALQQPVATDLRLVIGSLRISSSLERMGDLADHVAKLTQMRHPGSSVPEDVRPMFAQMGDVADQMATGLASLLRSWDLAEASEILAMDDQIDNAHRELFTTVLAPTWTHGVQAAIDTTLMSRYYERYADHAVAVARRVIQLVTGTQFSQTPSTGPAS